MIEIDGKPNFEVASPLDFWPDSPKGTLSPEDLFIASTVACYGVSLSGVAKRFHAEFISFYVRATGILQKGEFGWEFEQITLYPTIIVPTNDRVSAPNRSLQRPANGLIIWVAKAPAHMTRPTSQARISNPMINNKGNTNRYAGKLANMAVNATEALLKDWLFL